MKNVRPPQFLGNLYRDMRDRRLLFLAAALVVALLAVPVLLKSHPATNDSSVAPLTGAGKSDKAAVPAVVTQELGVTQYRKRLNQLTSKNPFHQQYTSVAKSARVHVSVGSAGSSSTATAGTGSLPPATTDTTTPSTSSTTPPTGGIQATSSPPVSSTPSSSGRSTHTKPTARYYAYRVGVKVGEPGKLKDRPEVKRLTMLPSTNRPLATFLGVTEDGKHAIFQISTDVDSVKGDGRCAPDPANCQYLAMKTGDKVNLHYVPGGKRYNLVLTDIHTVVVGHKPSAKANATAKSSQRIPKLGPG